MNKLISILIAIFTLAGSLNVRAAALDEIKDNLEKAKAAYAVDVEKYQKAVLDWFERRDENARKDGNKKLVDQIKAERDAFESMGELPKTTPVAIKSLLSTARTTLEAAYRAAIREYTKTKQDDASTAVESQLEDFKKNNTPLKPLPAPVVKSSTRAYDDFIDPVRDLLIKDWEREVKAIRNAIRDDEERAAKATTVKERQHFEKLIRDYKDRLEKVLKNDPPYISLDALKKMK